jgi:hypothetical protein
MARLPHPPATPALTRALREWSGWSGWFVVAAGAVLCVLGWYGVSGESVAEQQLPYLASATIPGAALIVAGAVLIASRPARRTEQADSRIETLYALLVADGAPDEAPPPHRAPDDSQSLLLAVPGGTLYHRRDCPLVADKPTAEAVDAAAVAERSLTPCPVCEPPAPPDGGSGSSGPDQPAADSPADSPADSRADSPVAAPEQSAPAAPEQSAPAAPDHPEAGPPPAPPGP